MYKIKYLDDAELDLLEIQSYIAEDSLFYSIEVLKEIRKTIDFLKDFPYLGPGVNKTLRKVTNPKYKYTIFYKVNEKLKIIEIISISKFKNVNYD